MDLHELTTAQRKLARQQIKDIQNSKSGKDAKSRMQNASNKYFDPKATNRAMAAGRAKDKSLAAATDERIKGARNDARKAQADKLRKKRAEKQGDLRRAGSTVGGIKQQSINSQEAGSASTKKVASNFLNMFGGLSKAAVQATGTDRKFKKGVTQRLKRFNQGRQAQRGLSTGTSDKQLRALDKVKQNIQAKKRGETRTKPADPWSGKSTVSRKQPGASTVRSDGAQRRALPQGRVRGALPPSRSSMTVRPGTGVPRGSAIAVRGTKPGQKRLPGAGQTGAGTPRKPGDLGKAARKDPKLRAKLIQQRNKGMKEEFSNWREEFIWEVDKKEKAPKMVKPMAGENTIIINPDSMKEETISEKKGLWDNIHARRKAGKAKRKPGDKNYPKTLDID